MANMQRKHNFFTLSKPERSLGQFILFLLKTPILLPSWIVSFLLARNLTNITLNPSQIKKQKPVHLVYVSDNPDERGNVIINLAPHESHKALRDYVVKFNSSIINLPFLSKFNKHLLAYDNPEDKAYVDLVLSEIDLLIEGKSRASKCANKKFSWSDIHLKGFEHLDNKLHAHFLGELYKKYGEDVVNQNRPVKLNFFTLETPDSAVLDSVEVSAQDEEHKPIAERKFVIACMARDQNYINWIKDFNYSAEKIGCTVIGFNYRGVCYSKGMVWTQNNMIDDALAQVERLLAMGAKPENIGLEGMCLGGAVATIAAAKLHERGLKVKLYNERSFRSIPRFLTGYILPAPHSNPLNPINWLRYLIAAVIYITTIPFIWLAGWHMDAASAWDKIPQNDKNYSIIRNHEHADPELHEEDGVVEDSWASIASLIDEQQHKLAKKLKANKKLTEEEKMLLADISKNHHFSTSPVIDRKGKLPHHLPRRNLVNALDTLESAKGYNMHQHMTDSFRMKFGPTSKIPSSPEELDNQPIVANNYPRRPLFLATSGGAGHISAITGIISALNEEDKNLQITQHQAKLYQDREATFMNLLIRVSIYLMSVPILGSLIAKIAKLLNFPRLPDHKEFWGEMSKLENAEIAKNSNPPVGRLRPYVDMLLDVYPFGYEAVSINNTLHRMEKADDVKLLVKQKGPTEKYHYKIAYDHFLNMLLDGAREGKPYTEIISTQPLSLAALCDAVKDYNEKYVNQKNKFLKNPLPTVEVHQYLTDLPSLGCDHFLSSLENLTPDQQQQMHLFAVNLGSPIVQAYLDGGHNFKGIHNLEPHANPMIRPGFKDKTLTQYLDTSREFKLKIKGYANNGGNWVAKEGHDEVVVAPHAKVASIMLGSVPSDATVSYVKHLIDPENNYDKVFVFGGLNSSIYKSLDDLVNTYPENDRQQINDRIVRLGNQTDIEMAPIMTRSDCVVIRGGGLSIMEQMALPFNPNKKFLIHHNHRENEPLTSGLTWEDGNVDCLMEFFAPLHVFARKTSPKLAYQDLKEAPDSTYEEEDAEEHTVLGVDELDTASPIACPAKPPVDLSKKSSSNVVAINLSDKQTFFRQKKKNTLQDTEEKITDSYLAVR